MFRSVRRAIALVNACHAAPGEGLELNWALLRAGHEERRVASGASSASAGQRLPEAAGAMLTGSADSSSAVR